MTDCKGFRKYAGAFADGELDTQSNAEALEHLKMCPACAERVNDVHQLKRALTRVWAGEAAPAAVAAGVRAAIKLPHRPAARPTPPLWVRRTIVPLGMAAAVVAAFLLWKPQPEVLVSTNATIQAEFASSTRRTHNLCFGAHPGGHHDASLGSDPAEVSRTLTDRLKLKVVIPDLSGEGLTFLGAGVCGIAGRKGAHAMYRAQDGTPVSLFSVAAGDCVACPAEQSASIQESRRFLDSGKQGECCVTGCAGPCVAYVLCAQMDHSRLEQLAATALRDI